MDVATLFLLGFEPVLGPGAGTIVGSDVVTRGGKVSGHRPTHHAQANKCDFLAVAHGGGVKRKLSRCKLFRVAVARPNP